MNTSNCPRCKEPLYGLDGHVTFRYKANWYKEKATDRLVAWMSEEPYPPTTIFECTKCKAYITSNYQEACRLVGAKEGKVVRNVS